MAGFDITTPTNSVVLRRARDGTASGEASFTVANQTRHAVRAQATPVAEAPTDPAWLEVEGAVERDFAGGETEAFIVAITVPRAAAPGEYPFRLDARSVALPDEEWGRGPVVRFQVPELPAEPPPIVEEEPPGYLETVGGALLGAFVVAIVLLGVGLAVGLGAASGGGGGGTGGGLGEAVGSIIASAVGFLLVVAFIAIAFAGLGAWLGPVIGAFLVLRLRGFPDPWLTAVPMVILMPLLGLPIVIAFGGIGGAIGIGGAVGAIWAVLTGLLAVSVPSLAARAFARWRGTGHL